MALIPRKPFDELGRFFDEDDWFLPVFPHHQKKPVMDVYETAKEIIAEVNLPGIEPKDIDIALEDQMLRVSGKSEEKKEEKKKGYWQKEIRTGSFERAIRLPVSVKEDKIDASYDKGVLKIVMPKVKKEVKKKKVKIKTKK